METKNILIMVAVVLGLLAVFAAANFTSPTGAAVAGQNGVTFNGSKELVFVDDISCKEWNLCFSGWDEESTTTTVLVDGNLTTVTQTHQVPLASGSCVKSVYNAISGKTLGSTPSGDVPIPPECLVQKDPAIQSVNTGDEITQMNVTNLSVNYCAGYPVGNCSVLNSVPALAPGLTCADYYNNNGFQCTGAHPNCTEGAACQDNGEMEYCLGTAFTGPSWPPSGCAAYVDPDPSFCEQFYTYNSVTGSFHNCRFEIDVLGDPLCREYPNSCKPVIANVPVIPPSGPT